MNGFKRRVERLEAVGGLHGGVYAIGLADTDEVVVLSMGSGAEHERMRRPVFEQRYPTAQIVDSLGTAEMWEAI